MPPAVTAAHGARPAIGSYGWLVANGTFLLAAFPYVSPFPLATDVQPVVYLVVIVFLVIWASMRPGVVVVDRSDVVFLGFAVVFALYNKNILASYGFEDARKSLTLLLAFVVFWITRRSFKYLSPTVVALCASVNLGAALLQIGLSNVYLAIAGYILPRVSTGLGRGATGLCPEPGFLAYVALFQIIVIGVMMETHQHVMRKWHVAVVVGASVAAILLSQSGVGVFLTLILGFVFLLQRYGLRGAVGAVSAAGAMVAALIVSSGVDISFRGLGLLRLVIMNPALLLQDSSFANRILEVALGLYSVFIHPFGTGNIVWVDTAQELSSRFNVGGLFVGVVTRDWVLRHIGDLSDFARHLSRMGIWFFAFPVIVWVLARDHRSTLTNVIRIYILLPIALAMPFSFPGFWFLLGTRGLVHHVLAPRYHPRDDPGRREA